MNFTVTTDNKNTDITLTQTKKNDILYLQVDMISKQEQIPESFSVSWKFSAKDCAFTWNPSMGDIHGLYFDWGLKTIKSRLFPL